MEKKIGVLVVDDSPFMCQALGRMIRSDPELEVIGEARDGEEALEKIEKLHPDIVTLDIEMPRMNGLESLKIIMEKMPLPVLMVSALTQEGAQATLEALSLGAIDFISKHLLGSPLNILKIKMELTEKIKRIFHDHNRDTLRPLLAKKNKKSPETVKIPQEAGEVKTKVVVIGASTGGPRALQELLPLLPSHFPSGVVVVQHMPPTFTSFFAERLNRICHLEVREAQRNEPLRPGHALITPGKYHLSIRKTGEEPTIDLSEKPLDSIYRPSVDIAMTTAAQAYPARCMGVLLTGMGHDGVEGMRAIKIYHGCTLAQDRGSCVVFGMPRLAIEAGVVDRVIPLRSMAEEMVRML